jgi:hypothetical protein
MFVALPGFLGSGAGGPPPPPYGTLLSSHCSGYSSKDIGAENYTDASGGIFNGMFTTWQELANGTGGSFWQSLGNNTSDIYSACWYPFGFYLQYDNGQNFVDWNGCGSNGSFGPTGSYYNYLQADGNGGTYSTSGGNTYSPPNAGDVIYQSGVEGCCTVYYDGNNGYYINDTCVVCPPAGTYLSSGCNATTGTDASGSYYEGAWNYGEFYADGSCGSYFNFMSTNSAGCYLPSGWFNNYEPYSNSLHWIVSDSQSSTVAEGDAQWQYGWNSTSQEDGSGGNHPASFNQQVLFAGDLISSGNYYDSFLSELWLYYVYYDGVGDGYYVVQYPNP